MSALKYWLWLTELPGLTNQTRLALLQHFPTPEDVYYAEAEEVLLTEGITREQAILLENKDCAAADRILADCQRLNVNILTLQDAGYPNRLRNIYDPPCLLYVRGRLPAFDDEAAVAVVGTRDCTPYGVSCAEKLGHGLAAGGAVVVSGLARGIDSAALRGALRAGGTVAAVLGNGTDVIYPPENQYLYEDVAAAGALVSEYPPGTPPDGRHFPVRNRIISALADAVIIIEAREKSGSLITADFALEQGKEVFALPGRANDPLSGGCNRLIQGGASLLLSPSDVLEFLGMKYERKLTIHKFSQNRLAKNENLVYASVDSRPRYLEEIAALCGLSVTECMEALLKLELAGLVFGTGNQYYKAE